MMILLLDRIKAITVSGFRLFQDLQRQTYHWPAHIFVFLSGCILSKEGFSFQTVFLETCDLNSLWFYISGKILFPDQVWTFQILRIFKNQIILFGPNSQESFSKPISMIYKILWIVYSSYIVLCLNNKVVEFVILKTNLSKWQYN